MKKNKHLKSGGTKLPKLFFSLAVSTAMSMMVLASSQAGQARTSQAGNAAKSGHQAKEESSPVLVEIGEDRITLSDLEKTLASSPFGVQFNTMDKNAQASLRGMILQRLVASRLLRAEAIAQGLDRTEGFVKDVESFRKGLLYRRYMDNLRASVKLPRESLKELMKEFRDKPEALAAAKASAITQRYRMLRVLAVQHMRETRKVRVFEDRIKKGMSRDVILLQGDNIGISYGDLVAGHDKSFKPEPAWIKERLYQQAELELVALDAEEQGVDISRHLKAYMDERLPAALSEKLEKQWIGGDKILRNYFSKHRDIGQIPARWHIGQLVVGDLAIAKRLRKAIVNGASLFKMAATYSIDPYGKKHNGDMGWLRQGSASPEIEKSVSSLKRGEISKIIKTPKGYHIVLMIDKRDMEQLGFDDIKDRIRQAFVQEKMSSFLKQLQKKYKIVWKMLDPKKSNEREPI
jgi:peptidyl-prolyl cis-trans isomerase C